MILLFASEMFREPIAMWVYFGFIILLGLAMSRQFLIQSGIVDKIRNKISDIKRKNKKRKEDPFDFNLNPFLLFLVGPILIFGFLYEKIKMWWYKHKWNVVLLLINAVFLVPLFLTIGGVIKTLPEFYFPLFVFYLMIMMGVFVARADNRRHGHGYGRYEDNRYERYPSHRSTYGYNNPSYRSTYKPKPRGLSQEQVSKKKVKIRQKLIKENIIEA